MSDSGVDAHPPARCTGKPSDLIRTGKLEATGQHRQASGKSLILREMRRDAEIDARQSVLEGVM
ncbi:hypothetical protein OAO87_01135 [bacterium]|nr:hypothetical protein [bacterium]